MNNLRFATANDAFVWYYHQVSSEPEIGGTKSLYNVGFTILNPLDNLIEAPWRGWKKSYAEAEWQWYESRDRNIRFISQHAKKWKDLADKEGNVNSNYGWQWHRNDQLNKMVDLLRSDILTRRASISIFDGKEIDYFGLDVPCTYAINFRVGDGKLHMSVMMRSNDLWFGFCNDQYCFSKLQLLISDLLHLPVGEYFHFANNLHLYHNQLNRDYHDLERPLPQSS